MAPLGKTPTRPPKHGSNLMAEINITPMVDVMLVLLVIFMVTAPLLVAGVRVDLPKSTAAKIARVQKPLILTINGDGAVFIGEERVERIDLDGKLKTLKAGSQQKEAEQTVYLRADRKLDYGSVLEIMGLVQNAGFARISLLSQVSEPPAAKEGKGAK